VHFAPGTNFQLGRPTHQWKRHSPTYLAGKHNCHPDLGGEWLNTSLMFNGLEQLLDFKVHALFHVREEKESAALFKSFHQQMRAGQPLLPGPQITLGMHPLCVKVLRVYEDLIQSSGGDFSKIAGDEWRQAKVMVRFEDQSDNSVSFQFINDTREDLEAHEFILDFRRGLPAGNVGIPKDASLRRLSDEWLAEVSNVDAGVSER
jgi:hypothetical protein